MIVLTCLSTLLEKYESIYNNLKILLLMCVVITSFFNSSQPKNSIQFCFILYIHALYTLLLYIQKCKNSSANQTFCCHSLKISFVNSIGKTMNYMQFFYIAVALIHVILFSLLQTSRTDTMILSLNNYMSYLYFFNFQT